MTHVGLAVALMIQAPTGWIQAPPLPVPVTNNAVAALELAEGPAVFSFLGLDGSRAWDGLSTKAFRWNLREDEWAEVESVPGPGRLAATAEVVGDRIFLFGGYTVAEDGSENSLPNVDIYEPATDSWSKGAPIPVPVDDAVSGVWRDSLIYLVSGWHDTGNEVLVQIFDPAENRWAQGTPIPGPAVFGHAGGISRDAIVYVNGVRSSSARERGAGAGRYLLDPTAWRGDIDPSDPTRIEWSRIGDHPGPGLYRAAAGTLGTRVVFVGGTDNPYNFDGIGYDGRPARPVGTAFMYDVVAEVWSAVPAPRTATMDHRNLVRVGGWLILVGGMLEGQRVTPLVQRISVIDLISGG